MRSPRDMNIIEIDITNACPNTCSNCTRFCGHHVKPFFMDFKTFKEAVDSLDGFEGKVGVMGGEPTVHPEFEKFVRYIREKRGHGKVRKFRKPPADLNEYVARNFWQPDGKVALVSSLSDTYYKHFEIINDTFGTQVLNDHVNLIQHQALLMPRKELGISDELWIKKRNACWIQNCWSAGITPKGAFFCEVAASLDMLFDGPGGWKVEPGWWKRTPEDFEDQLHWCELCSGCLDVPKRLANDGRDDVTPKMLEKLMEINSPKARRGMCVVHNPQFFDSEQYKTYTYGSEYIKEAGSIRTTEKNKKIYPRDFYLISPEQVPELGKNKHIKDWVLVGDNSACLEQTKEWLKSKILNPGCIYLLGDDMFAFNIRSHSLRHHLANDIRFPENIWALYPLDKIIHLDKNEEKMLEENKNLKNELGRAREALETMELRMNKINRFMPESSLRRRIAKKVYNKIFG